MQLDLSEWVKLQRELYPIYMRMAVWLLLGTFSLLSWSIIVGLLLWTI